MLNLPIKIIRGVSWSVSAGFSRGRHSYKRQSFLIIALGLICRASEPLHFNDR